MEIPEKLVYNTGRQKVGNCYEKTPDERFGSQTKTAGKNCARTGVAALSAPEYVAGFAAGADPGGGRAVHLRDHRRADEPVSDTAQTGSRYRTAYICAETPTVPCYDAGFAETGAVARGSAVTYLAEKSLKKDGSTYYLTYFDDLQYGYVDSNCFTDDPNAVVLEKTIYVRTPQNLRLSADGFELGGLVQQGTELQVLGFDSISNGVVHLYHVTDGESTGYISGEYTVATPELATEIYDRFGSYSIHMGRLDRWGGGDGRARSTIIRARRRTLKITSCRTPATRFI